MQWGFNALLGFDILNSGLCGLLGAVSRLSSTGTNCLLSSFSSFMGLGKPSTGTTRLEQDQCHDPPCGTVRGCPPSPVTGAPLVPVPAPPERSRSQNTSFLTSVQLCPALGARSPPQPAEREQEVEEKNRHSRCGDASEPPPPLPTRRVLPRWRRSQRLQGLCRAQLQPWRFLARQSKAKKIQILFLPPTHNVCSLGQCGFPGADLKAAVQKSTWPSLNVADTALPLPIWSLAG